MKRLFDLAVSLPAFFLLALPMLTIGIAVWIDSGRPVLFSQIRVGKNGVPFRLLKFRTMVVNAESLGPQRTATNDRRITRIGRFLRRTSLDELPQLLNVVRGDMSLVGPRPDVPAQACDYAPDDWTLRCSVRPGLTGLAQAVYRSRATPAQRLAADLDYVRDHSLSRDMLILWRTVGQVLQRGGN